MARVSELDILGSNDFNVNSVFRQLAVFLLLFFVRGGCPLHGESLVQSTWCLINFHIVIPFKHRWNQDWEILAVVSTNSKYRKNYKIGEMCFFKHSENGLAEM